MQDRRGSLGGAVLRTGEPRMTMKRTSVRRVLAVPMYRKTDVRASSRLRVFSYLDALRSSGLVVDVFEPPARDVVNRGVGVAQLLRMSVGADLVWLQKRLPPAVVLQMWRCMGARYVFDFDDALYACPDDVSASQFNRDRTLSRLKRVLRGAEAVMAGNEVLASYAKDFVQNVHVIPTSIDLQCYDHAPQSAENSIPIIGWCGNGEVHWKNLLLLKEPLQELSRSHKFKFTIIGSRNHPELERVFGKNTPYATTLVPWMSEEDMIQAMTQFDVGVMPLLDTDWGRGKCAYKLLSYMALCLPVVCSPIGVNRQIVHDDLNGFCASTSEEWVHALDALLASPNRATDLGKQGRQIVECEYSKEVVSKQIVSMLQDCAKG